MAGEQQPERIMRAVAVAVIILLVVTIVALEVASADLSGVDVLRSKV